MRPQQQCTQKRHHQFFHASLPETIYGLVRPVGPYSASLEMLWGTAGPGGADAFLGGISSGEGIELTGQISDLQNNNRRTTTTTPTVFLTSSVSEHKSVRLTVK